MCGDREGTGREIPQGTCAGGRWKPSPCTPAVGKGWGERIPKVKAGLRERQGWHSCPWRSPCLARSLQLGCHGFGGGPCTPLHQHTSVPSEASPGLNCPEAVVFSLNNTSLLLYKFIITRESCSDWRTHLLLSCGFQLISSQLTVFKYSESCKFPYHSS